MSKLLTTRFPSEIFHKKIINIDIFKKTFFANVKGLVQFLMQMRAQMAAKGLLKPTFRCNVNKKKLIPFRPLLLK